MSDKCKAMGRGDKGGSANSTKKAGRGSSMMGKWQGNQGQKGSLGTPPCAPCCATQLNNDMTAKDE